MAGRKSIPTELKRQKGTLRKHRTIDEVKPQQMIGIPALPDNLNIQGEEEWVKVTRELHSLGMLTMIDMSLVNAYCFHIGQYYEACEMILTEGAVINIGGKKVEVHGQEVVVGGKNEKNPWYDIMKTSAEQAAKIGVLFGITPSARVKIPAKKPEKSKHQALLDGNG